MRVLGKEVILEDRSEVRAFDLPLMRGRRCVVVVAPGAVERDAPGVEASLEAAGEEGLVIAPQTSAGAEIGVFEFLALSTTMRR